MRLRTQFKFQGAGGRLFLEHKCVGINRRKLIFLIIQTGSGFDVSVQYLLPGGPLTKSVGSSRAIVKSHVHFERQAIAVPGLKVPGRNEFFHVKFRHDDRNTIDLFGIGIVRLRHDEGFQLFPCLNHLVFRVHGYHGKNGDAHQTCPNLLNNLWTSHFGEFHNKLTNHHQNNCCIKAISWSATFSYWNCLTCFRPVSLNIFL